MPAPIEISVNEREKLKQLLKNHYNVKIQDSFDCKLLSSEIGKKLKINLSESTLKRFYGFTNYSGNQSKYTLNQLAKAVGFADFDNYTEYLKKFDTNVINQNIQLYHFDQESYRSKLINIINKIILNNWESTYQIRIILSLAIEKRDHLLIENITKIELHSDINQNEDYLSSIFQVLYFEAKKNNQFVIDFVGEKLNESYTLQKYLMQIYVDENELDNFYGYWLERTTNYLIEDFELFKRLILIQKLIILRRKKLAIIEYNQVKQILKQTKNSIHPILKARISAWDLILNDNIKTFEKSVNGISNTSDLADFFVFSARLIWLFGDKNWNHKLLSYFKIEQRFDTKSYTEKSRYNLLYLTIAISLFKQNQIEQAKELFKIVDKNIFGLDIVSLDFYKIWIEQIDKEECTKN